MAIPRLPGAKAALTSAAFLFVALSAGCAGPDAFGGSRRSVVEWGLHRGFAAQTLEISPFILLAMRRGSAEILNVYFEGDGAAWPSPYHPPRDPTPDAPVALALADRDPAPAVAYLGRPCQYLSAAELSGCSPHYWTDKRFAPEVVAAYRAALDTLKAGAGARQLRLIGYSGGGVLATLLAERRQDVLQLVTVAAPLTVAEWTQWHEASPLTGSLDPGQSSDVLPTAIHFVGSDDRVVPPAIARAFTARRGGRLRVAERFDHACCWSRDWPRLLEETR